MTPSLLQDALAKELERLFADKTFFSQSGPAALKIFKQFTPLDQYGESNEIFPYLLVSVEEFAQESATEPMTCKVIIMAAVYDDNEDNQGYKDLLNILEDISQHLRANTTLDKRFRLAFPLKCIMSEDVYPYFFGAVETNWTLPGMYGFKGVENT